MFCYKHVVRFVSQQELDVSSTATLSPGEDVCVVTLTCFAQIMTRVKSQQAQSLVLAEVRVTSS